MPIVWERGEIVGVSDLIEAHVYTCDGVLVVIVPRAISARMLGESDWVDTTKMVPRTCTFILCFCLQY
jgi:hypothetical protein